MRNYFFNNQIIMMCTEGVTKLQQVLIVSLLLFEDWVTVSDRELKSH